MLYQLNLNDIKESQQCKSEDPRNVDVLEKHIEELLKTKIIEIIPEENLMIIAQERRRQEEADLLALDREGKLFIFEIKRWKSVSENLLQALRYGQIFGRYNYESLENFAKRQNKLSGELLLAHQEHFNLPKPLEKGSFNQDQTFVLVTYGVDSDSLDAISYWKEKGVNIESLTYRLYKIGDEVYVQMDRYNPLDEPMPDIETKCYVVNTNASYMNEAWKDMVGDGSVGKAAAYYGRKNAVQRIEKDAIVYLYHTGQGIIAKGSATAGYQSVSYNGDPGEEFNVPLKLEWALKDQNEWHKAPKAWQINQSVGASHRFRRTVFEISEEMAKEIDRIHKENEELLNDSAQAVE